MCRDLTTGFLLILGLWAAGPALADDTDGEFVDVELVNVEVWVTDDEGRPVLDLPAEAFRVEEDGEAVDLAFFAEIRGSRADTPVETPNVDTDGAPAMESTPEPSADPGHLVLYFDDLHLSLQSRAQRIEDFQSFLETSGVDPERIMVVRQDLSLYVEAPFGSDREQIGAALDRLSAPRSSEASREFDRQAALQALQAEWRLATETAGANPNQGVGEAGCDTFLNRVLPFVESASVRAQQRVRTSLEHLRAVSSFLSAIPGVKSLIYVADSLETTPGSSLLAFVDGLCPTSIMGHERPDLSGISADAFRQLARSAAANRVTFYGLQAGGLRVGSAFSAGNESFDLRSATRFQNELRSAERTGLQYLADETGGRAIFDRNAFEGPLRTIVDHTASYYSLAYAPDHPGDGGEHQIRVELTEAFDARGLRVRHRKGYLHKAADTRLGEKLLAALFMGFGDNPLQLALGAGPPTPSSLDDTPEARFILHVYVPAASVTFVPTAEGTEAEIFLQVASRSPRGGPPSTRSKTWSIRGPAADGATFDLEMELELDAGPNTIAVAVRDERSREVSFVSTSLVMPAPEPRTSSGQPGGVSATPAMSGR